MAKSAKRTGAGGTFGKVRGRVVGMFRKVTGKASAPAKGRGARGRGARSGAGRLKKSAR